MSKKSPFLANVRRFKQTGSPCRHTPPHRGFGLAIQLVINGTASGSAKPKNEKGDK